MGKKRRRERSLDWKQEYKALVGERLVDKHSDVIDQVIPQCAVFMTAVLFHDEVFVRKEPLASLLSQTDQEIFARINQHLEYIIDQVKADERQQSAWPTLMKSQSFFTDPYLVSIFGGARRPVSTRHRIHLKMEIQETELSVKRVAPAGKQ